MNQDRRESSPYDSRDESADPEGPTPPAGELETFLDGLDLFRPRTVYFSTPITTGRWFYEELLARGARGPVQELPMALTDEVRQQSMRRNERIARESIAQLKLRLDEHNFINPAALQASWSQQRFLDFWVRIIHKYAGQIVLAQDWGYSTGSSFECATALTEDIPVFDFEGRSLTASEAQAAVSEAVRDLESRGLVPSGLKRVLAQF